MSAGSGDRPVQLHLLRHAHAGDPERWRRADAERPLSDKGVAQAERLAAHLARIGFAADAIVSSPKVRARRTAEIVAEALGLEVRLEDRLAGTLDPDVVAGLLRDVGSPRHPVLVGHDPDFSDLATSLSGARSLSMKKGAIARIDIVRGFTPGGGELRWLLPPDLLSADTAS